jgi:hypothetical protein
MSSIIVNAHFTLGASFSYLSAAVRHPTYSCAVMRFGR